MISGFLVTQSWLARAAIVPFVAARALRIYPALIGAVVFTVLLAGLSSALDWQDFLGHAQTRDYIVHVAPGWEMKYRLPGAFPANPIAHDVNGSLWTLPVELRLYVAVLAAGVLGLLARPVVWLLALSLLLELFAWRPDLFPMPPYDEVTRNLVLLFALGSLAYVWRGAIPVSLAAAAIALTLVIADPAGLARGALFAPLLAYVMLVAAYHPRLQWPAFNRVGDYSYGVYVYSFPIQQTLLERIPGLDTAAAVRAGARRNACRGRLLLALRRAARARTKIAIQANGTDSMNAPKTLREASCADDYDPNSMAVDKARAMIRQFLAPVTATERVAIRAALDRVLAQDVVSPIAVPGHDNSAMDGWAVRFADLRTDSETELKRVGDSFAGKPHGGPVGPGETVRIFTGGIMPAGTDSVVMQERATEIEGGVRIPAARWRKAGQNRRFAGEDLKQGQVVFEVGQPVRPAELGMLASLGINEVTVYRKLRVAFFSTGDELKSIGTPLAEGEIYDSNRYTLYGMLTRLNCDIVDMGVVPDVPEELERAFATAAANADVVITSGGVSVGEADFVRRAARQAGRGAVLEDRDEARSPARVRQDRRRAFLRSAGQSGGRDGDVLRSSSAMRC